MRCIAYICAYVWRVLLRYLSCLNLLRFILLTNREILLGSHEGRYRHLLWWPLWYCRNEPSPVSPHSGTSRESSRERRRPLQLLRTWQASTLSVSRRLPRGMGNTKRLGTEPARRSLLLQSQHGRPRCRCWLIRGVKRSSCTCPGIDYGISRSRNLVQKVHFDPQDDSSGKSV